MTDHSSSWSYGGSDRYRNGYQWDYYSNPRNNSAITRMQRQYWVTKEAFCRKLGKKEDENIVASDAELDAKLELFKSIQDSCSDLLRIIDRYQERLVLLAQEENSMGKFLKECGRNDKTGAGSMMLSVGRTMAHTGQLRIELRLPLIRLFQEVETFRQRAVEDTLRTVESMESSRTEYRASLNWMKDVSVQLDPDTFNQLDKFRKVQAQVKKSKGRFDKLKLDCLEKVDLLAAARCNMFSHALIAYHNTMLSFASSSTAAFTSVMESAKEHRKFEFTVIKELSELKVEPAVEAKDETPQVPEQPSESTQEPDEKLVDFDDDLTQIGDESAACSLADLVGDLSALSTGTQSAQFMPSALLLMQSQPSPKADSKDKQNAKSTSSSNQGLSNWLDLFSELDPLANPDSIGRPSNEPLRDC